LPSTMLLLRINGCYRAAAWLRRLIAGLSRRMLSSILGYSVWDLRCTKWHSNKFFSEYCGFPLSLSIHQCSILIHSTITDAYIIPAIKSFVKQYTEKMLHCIHPVAPEFDVCR
jgi:hypothetical protein